MRFEVHDAAAPGHERHGARDFPAIDVRLDGFVDSPQALGGHAHILRLAKGHVSRGQRRGENQQEREQVNRFHDYPLHYPSSRR